MNEKAVQKIEKDDVTIYPDFYVQRSYTGTDKKEKTLRIYESRDEINKVCIMDGKLPAKDNELVIDRMFADNNKDFRHRRNH